ncbi:MAG TPA: hypothetical protein VL500_00165 [Candidatus Eisenbacteria bacterium]|nr:hypothetical protein [Candidatus Eisenbacteria bacterium]
METKKLPFGWIALGVVLVFGIAYGGCALSFRSDCVAAEAGIKAQYKQNQNNYDNMWKKFKEMAQVPEMYVEDLKKVYDGAIKARYGENGSQAAIQFIHEHNPDFDAAMYTKLQSAIEAGRNGFEADQKQLIDKKRQYEVLLGGSKALFVGFWFGFPRIDLDKYDIVTSDETQKTFQDKKSDEIRLR